VTGNNRLRIRNILLMLFITSSFGQAGRIPDQSDPCLASMCVWLLAARKPRDWSVVLGVLRFGKEGRA